MEEFIVLEYFTGDWIEHENIYDDATVYGPFPTIEKAIKKIIDKNYDIFVNSIGYISIDEGPLEPTIYTSKITKKEVKDELFEKKSFEIHGKKYEIRELVKK